MPLYVLLPLLSSKKKIYKKRVRKDWIKTRLYQHQKQIIYQNKYYQKQKNVSDSINNEMHKKLGARNIKKMRATKVSMVSTTSASSPTEH